MRCLFIIAFLTSLTAAASPVLIMVDLPDIESKKAWHALGIPTYQFIGRTAIAECSEEKIAALERKGFRISIIDREPWSRDYYVVSAPYDMGLLANGRILFEHFGIKLVKAGRDRADRIIANGLRILPVRRRPLSERFWTMSTKKIVGPKSLPWDPLIQDLVEQVNVDSINSYIQRLQDFRTRQCLSDSCAAAAAWIYQKLNGWGYASEYDSVWIHGSGWNPNGWPGIGWDRNVIARSSGTMTPSKQVIICGHFDSTTYPDSITCWTQAPGADDNATGTAAVLEAARILRQYDWEPSMVYACWTAEEPGALGSLHYAVRADSQNVDIGGVINCDMVGYQVTTPPGCHLFYQGAFSTWLAELYYQVGNMYVPGLTLFPEQVSLGWGSDETSFTSLGYPGIFLIEHDYQNNPNYHSVNDLLSTLTPELYTNTVRVTVAVAAILGIYPSPVRDVEISDAGDGSRLVVNWSPSPETDVSGYRIYYGLSSGSYSDTVDVAGRLLVVDTLENLQVDSTYYIVIVAVDDDGHYSYSSFEETATPRSVPAAPAGLAAAPVSGGISLAWRANQELDLQGYRLYRAVDDTATYDSLNMALLGDTTFSDSPLSGAHRYYYKIRAFDLDGNPSPLSARAYGRPATLDQGVLVVDETRNWTTNPWPRDTAQDSFYDYVLEGITHQQYDMGNAAQRPLLADLVPFSSVLWHGDDYTELMASGSIADLKAYLDFGGKLWMSGWKMAGNLRGSATYPFNPADTSFLKSYLKISSVDISGNSDSFLLADGLLGYPDLEVDSLKGMAQYWNGYMLWIEAYAPAAGGEAIFTMDMKGGSGPYQGQPCGIRYLGPIYRTALFGLPLLFMDRDQARMAAQQVMADFGETGVSSVPVSELKVYSLELSPGVPNPFSKSTIIKYQMTQQGRVDLRVYNIAGQAVRTLFSGVQKAGAHSVRWDGRDGHGRIMPDGIYFARLATTQGYRTVKITILK